MFIKTCKRWIKMDELTDTERCILRKLLEEQLTKIFVRKTLAIAYRGILSKLENKEG